MKRILAVVAIIAIALSTVGVASERANATFKKSRVLDPEGKERKAALVFGGKTLTIHRKGHSDPESRKGRLPRPFSQSEINDEVVRLAWSIASWTWDGHGPIDHSPEAQSRRGVASAKVRRYLAYERDRFIVARLDAGESTRAVAREFGVSRWTVRTARAHFWR